MSMMKRMLSLLLALALLMGNIPAVAFAEETEIPAETEIVAAEETLAPTEAVTEPAETVTPTEVVTEPAVEETVALTQPAVPEETAAPTEIADEAALEMQWHTIVPEVDLPDNEELHAAYIEQVLYDNRISTLGIAAGNRLSGDEKLLYDALVPYIKEIANGERASTVISVGQQVGEEYIPDEKVTFSETYETDAAVSETVSHAITALLSDLPFEMYWYDKTAGCSYGYLLDKYGNLLYLVFTFPAAVNYAGSGNGTVNTEKTGAAAEAVHNAESIISEYASSSDYEKLVGYRDEICKLVSYNHDAAGAGDFSGNDDPWQLIYVFDGDPNTNVVCEGYSKAFMYLCDLTDFAGDVSCYTVSGLMNGGGHMWNIVTIGGSNYMVDVTNSDDGSVGMYGGLFLVGGAGSAAEGYSFIGVEYTYDNETKSLWGTGADSILTLAAQDYDPNAGGVDENIIASGTCGDNLIWVLDKEGILTISGTGKMDIWLNDVPWYEHREAVKMVIIENGVTNIGSSAFEECNNLTSVAIPDSVTQIGSSAFWECGSLEHVEIPDSVTSIGNYAFYYCEKLAQVTIGNGVTSIGKNAFYACSSLESVVIPDSVTSLGEEAFAYCSNLKSVQLPNSITSISEAAFGACISLTSIEIPNTVTSIGDLAFGQCINLVRFNVPNSVTNIGTAAFLYCGSLTEITFEADAPVIASDAFTDVSAIAYYPANNPTWTAAVMQNYGGTITWKSYTPEGSEDTNIIDSGKCGDNLTWVLDEEGTLTISGTGKMADYSRSGSAVPWYSYRTTISTIVVEAGVTSIGNDAFDGCSNLTNITIPDSVTSIGNYAFYGCSSLTSVDIGNGVTSIGNYAFYGCSSLTSVDIGNGVTSIGIYAFSNCSSLTNITIPDSVTSMGNGAFDECSNLTSVDIGNGVTSIGNYAFNECSNLTNITIPDSVTSIGIYAFYECRSLMSVDIGNGVTSIGSSAFAHCSSLTSIEIPAGVATIENWAFYDCSNLTSVNIGNGVTSIGSSAFSNCSNLTSVDIGNGVTSIGSSAFAYCINLTSVDIGNGVTSIGSSAFAHCIRLREITFKGDAPEIAANAFKNVTATAYYPADNATWTEEVMQNYGGTITWTPVGGVDENIVASGTCGENLTWVLDKEGTLTISGSGAMEDYDPSLNAPWYDHCAEITAIVIEEGVTNIGSYAFHYCNNAASIVIPDGVTAIGRYAFLGCEGLTELNLPATVNAIDKGAFRGCKGFTDITIPASVKAIGMEAFGSCKNLTTVTFEGDAPEFVKPEGYEEQSIFGEQAIVAYYPANNPTWTADVMQNYGGTITWKPYGEPQVLPKPVVNAAGNPVTGGGILTWEHDGEADYYKVYRATSKSGKYKSYKTVTEAYAEVDVKVGKTYYYKVKAICDADASLNSGYSSVAKVTGKCAQPEIAVAPKLSSGKPVVKWSKVSSAKKYEVYRATEENGTYKKVKTTTSTSYTDSKAELGTTYYYKVKAIASKSTYNSVFSEIDSCLTILAQPDTELSINKTTGKPVIEWEKISGAIGYEILWAESEKGEYAKLEEYQGGLSFEDSTAEPDKDYWYKVNAIGVSENLNNSGDAEMIHATLAKPAVSFGVNSITGKPVMTWEEVDGAVEYKIYRSSKSTKSYKAIATVTETEYAATSASVGKAYYYKVIAIGENCKSAYSSYKKLTAKCARPEITAIGADLSSGKPAVKWDKVSGAKKYYVYRATEIDGEYEKVKSTTKTSFTDTKAKVGTEYFYKVKAIASKSTYNSIESEAESCLTILAQPELELSVNKTTGKPSVSWEAVTGANGYEIYRSENGDEYELISTQTELTYTDESAVVDGQYTYKVKAIANDPALNSAESVEESIYCACEKPSISIELDGKKPMVSWDPVEGATKYYVYRSTKKSSGYKKVATVEEGESYRDSKAKKGTTYYYKIVAVSENAKSAYSNVVKIKSK